VRALRRFARISLQPGEARIVSFTLRADDFAFPGPDLRPMVEPGFFTVGMGGNSVDLKEARFELVQ
jgi:beta-glucosidase